jgi:hypothetical protein
MKEGSRTPWGKADYVKEVAPGIWQVSTPGHGGYKLDRARNARVHAAWRQPGGWYEEDCAWAIVELTFPALAKEAEHAARTVKEYWPDKYTVVTGQAVAPEESSVLRERAFCQSVGTSLVTVSAWGDWQENVPAGFVGVYAVPGRDRRREGKYFLVSDAEYDARDEFGLVIDPSKHATWTGPKGAAATKVE